MPTATSTLTTRTPYSNQVHLKGTIPLRKPSPPPPPPPLSATTATLRTLYNRAARAFLLRDISLTHSLIESAFTLIHPPSAVSDLLSDQRRKWDILRITLESTVYSSHPTPDDSLPRPLQDSLVASPQALLTSIYTRSLALFTPGSGVSQKSKATPSYLPSQVLITLIYSSLRIDCPDVGRGMIEDWLSHREVATGETKDESYEKILELYCLYILPKLDQWDYATEFLEYEGELLADIREGFKKSLKALQAEATPSHQPYDSAFTTISASSSRVYSPAPSSSSSSSSLSTTSTHTVVPSTKRATHTLSNLTPLNHASISTTSLSSDSTATPRQRSGRPMLKSRTANSSSTSYSSTHLPRPHPQAAAMRSSSLSTYALIKASLAPYLTTSNISTFFILFVIFPFVSLVLRARHKRRKAIVSGNPGSYMQNNAALARRRLQINEAGLLGRVWSDIVRVVLDTVRMAGSGLV
ncbi:hypothetical protein BDZ94DRAFT_1251378 [Collybia nuda]|uniref:Uncharacterized protein n=1 Tax=Collybia nuda TaxID=64659 RepID=A0A9P5YAZ6_9AGAR|nr:hypothetical protein BDZ94DRAFT_1251378 [Collybia nuda]